MTNEQQNNECPKNIWELYGLKENPFSTYAINVAGGSVPIDSFVGRDVHRSRLMKIFGSRGGSRTFVYGDIGVGKTSFVNVCRHNARANGFFTPIKEITTLEIWEPEDFIFNTLSAIYATLKITPDRDRIVSPDIFKKLESLFEIGRTSINAGISIGGFGGNYEKDVKPTERLPYFSIQQLFSDVIADINSKTKKETIIHYNNLELLKEKKIRSLFENLRDFFQTPGVHFVFLGNLFAFSVIMGVPRFASNLTDTPFSIEPLSLKEVKEILRKRINLFKIEGLETVCPYTDDALQVLYELMNGNIREILNSLATVIICLTAERAVVIDKNKLAKTLNDILEKRWLQPLSPRAKDVLFIVAQAQNGEITNKSIADKLNISRSNITNYIHELESSGCVRLKRKNGKDKFWTADPKMRWGLLKEDAQQTLVTS